MDGSHLEKRQQYTEKHHRGKDGGKKRKRKTKNYATRLDDRRGRRRRNEEKGTKQGEMASMDIRTCVLKAENERRREEVRNVGRTTLEQKRSVRPTGLLTLPGED